LVNGGEWVAVPADCEVLLLDRWMARRRACLQFLPLLVVGLAVYWTSQWGPYAPTDNGKLYYDGTQPLILQQSGRHDLASLTSLLLLICALILWRELVRRAELRIAKTLPRRATLGVAISAVGVLRRAGIAFIAVCVVWDAMLSIVLFYVRGGFASWTFLAAFLLSCGFAAFGVARAVSRPAIAVDQASLVFDERLRASDALKACTPLMAVALLFSDLSNTGTPSSQLDLLRQFADYAPLMAWLAARWQRPWQPPTHETETAKSTVPTPTVPS
jgi:hypothetical protein